MKTQQPPRRRLRFTDTADMRRDWKRVWRWLRLVH